MKELIEDLCGVFGPSGQEERISEAIVQHLEGLVDEVRSDRLGNLIAVKRPTDSGANGKRIMLAAHMDEIGVMVTHVDAQGFCRFTTMGGVITQTLIGSRVEFANGVEGAFGLEGRAVPRGSADHAEVVSGRGRDRQGRCKGAGW